MKVKTCFQILLLSRFLSYVFKNNFLWVFSCSIRVVDCWLVPSCWSDKCSLILLLVLGCDIKFSVDHIQIRDMDFLPLPTWVKSWWGCRLGVTSCWSQLIVFIDINIIQVHCPRLPLLVFDLCILHLLDYHLLILKIFLWCDCKLSVGRIQIGHTDLLTPQFCGRLCQG